ncbi:MAG: rhodanese-like domain-containing protein [Defluviitaleaceae bacterium]|nr:rhodanese-like domain-containing protein [Defluviitaleaceae bacterium]
MRILIIGATQVHLAAAARLRRLDEAAKIIMIDEAADIAGIVVFKHKYNIEMRCATQFISADVGYSSIALLQDALTHMVYQEEVDKIINTEPTAQHPVALAYTEFTEYFDGDIAAHLLAYITKHTPDIREITVMTWADDIARGRRIADEVYGRPIQAENTMPLRMADFHDLKLAIFGATEQELNHRQIGHMYSVAPIAGGFCKLIYDDGGNILGFAALGHNVENYVNIVATICKMGGNIHNLLNSQLAEAQNPLHILGKIAQNVIEKRLFMAYPDEITQIDVATTTLLDVRPAHISFAQNIEGAVNIPLDSLRESLYRLERGKEIITICADGKDSYLAARILSANGFRARHLTGGMAYATPFIATPKFTENNLY